MSNSNEGKKGSNTTTKAIYESNIKSIKADDKLKPPVKPTPKKEK